MTEKTNEELLKEAKKSLRSFEFSREARHSWAKDITELVERLMIMEKRHHVFYKRVTECSSQSTVIGEVDE